MEEFDFMMETKLRNQAPELHRIFADNVVCCQRMLRKYSAIFPSFTDHTALHSIEVIAFCNKLVGNQIDKLNCDEIFVLLMGAYLHDSGMGINQHDFNEFSDENPKIKNYIETHPDADMAKIIRKYHNEFSGNYVHKYAEFFDFPSSEYIFAVAQVCRGHRKTNLWDENEYPTECKLPNGNVVHVAYISALLRLADELDIAIDRNIQFLYNLENGSISPRGLIEFKKHKAIKEVKFEDESFTVLVDYSDESIREGLNEVFEKLTETLNYCVEVVDKRTPFRVNQRAIKIVEF